MLFLLTGLSHISMAQDGGSAPADDAGSLLSGSGVPSTLEFEIGSMVDPAAGHYVIVGDVRLSGSYPWRAGTTMGMALATAGGLLIAPVPNDDEKDSPQLNRVTAQEEFDITFADYYASVARRARRMAERDTLERIQFPDDLIALRYDSTIGDIVRGEEQLLTMRRQSTQGQRELLQQQMALLNRELEALEGQLSSARQIGRLIEEELGVVKSLKEKGLVRRSQLLTTERSMYEQKADQRKIAVDIIRVKQDINDLEAEIYNLEQDGRIEAMEAIQAENENLARLKRALVGARERLNLQIRRSFENLRRVGAGFNTVKIARKSGVDYHEFEAAGDTAVLPGDIITVIGFYDTESY